MDLVSILAVWLWVSYLASLSPRSFICKEGRITLTWELGKGPLRSCKREAQHVTAQDSYSVNRNGCFYHCCCRAINLDQEEVSF